MRQIGKTLYVLSEKAYINIEGEDFVIESDERKTRVPASMIESIVVFGNATVSSFLIRFCSQRCITLTYASKYGKYYGSISGEFNRCVVLRKKQYDLYDTEKALAFAKNIMLAKFVNSKELILQGAKDISDEEAKSRLIAIAGKISAQKDELADAETFDSLLGIEGSVAQDYFEGFDIIVRPKDRLMCFECRSKRPPENFCNALLSFMYMLFCNDITAALESQGLDSYLGYYHRIHPGRQSLSLDIIEEFRQSIVDRFVISVINRSQITSKDFETGTEGIRLSDPGRKKAIGLWEEYKSQPIEHKLSGKTVEIKVLPYLQAQLLAQYIRGDIDSYPPFVRS